MKTSIVDRYFSYTRTNVEKNWLKLLHNTIYREDKLFNMLIRQNEMYCFCKTKCDYFLQNEMY